jgi:hypothetical protein
VTSYIKKPSCIILLTVACESELIFLFPTISRNISICPRLADFENQGAHHLTKQYDPDGKRTIGIYTLLVVDLSSTAHK